MSCASIRERLSDLIDGELPADEEARVREHLEACPDCRERHEELRSVVRAVRGVPWPEPPEGFAEDVARRLRPRPRPYARLFWMAPVAAAAGLLLLASLFPRTPAVERAAGSREVARSVEARPLEKIAADGAERSGIRGAGGPRNDEILVAKSGTAEAAEPQASPVGGGAGAGDSGPGANGAAGTGRPQPAGPVPGEPPAPGETARSGRGGPRDAGAGDDTDAQLELLVRGLDPDAAAGTVLAELELRRSRLSAPGADPAPAREATAETKVEGEEDAECEERVLTDEGGSPAGLLLCVTDAELHFVRSLLARRSPEALESRQGGGERPREGEAGAKDAPRRLRVRVVFEDE